MAKKPDGRGSGGGGPMRLQWRSRWPPALAELGSVTVGEPRIPHTGAGVARDLALYSAARLALVAVLTVLLVVAGVPLLVAILLAVVVALPLSMVLLSSLRARVNAGLAVIRERRQAERERLRRQLRGDEG